MIAEVRIPIPGMSDISDAIDKPLNQVDFACTSFSTASGIFEVNTSWGTDKNGVSLAPKLSKNTGYNEQQLDLFNSNNKPGYLNLKKLIEWVQDSKIDPNDPRNLEMSQMKNLLKKYPNYDNSATEESDVFRVGLPNWLHDLTLSVEPDDSGYAAKRFEILGKRNKGEIVLTQPVPLYFTASMVESKLVQHTVRDETEDRAVSKWNSRRIMSELKDSDQSSDLGFLKRIRELQLIRKNLLEKPKHVDQYVLEARILPVALEEIDYFAFFRAFRPLNPHRMNRKMLSTTEADHCKLMIQILQGYNLPVRQSSNSFAANSDTPLRPFCEFTFQKRKFHTSTVFGNNPLFNETLSVPIVAKNDDFKAEALMETDLATEILYLNIYDEIIVDLIQDDRERERETYYRRDKVWIGSLEIPFSSIWERSRVFV